MVNEIEQRIFALARRYNGVYLFNNEKKQRLLTADTDFDTDMKLDVGEAEDLMDEFLENFKLIEGGSKLKLTIPMSLFRGILSRSYQLHLCQISLSVCL